MATETVSTDHNEHDSHVAHHFDDAEQQFEAANLGMWAFLTTEVMFFGGFFAAYAVYRSAYPLAFVEGSLHLSHGIGGILGFVNTLFLLCSSLTMVLAVHAAQTNNSKGAGKLIVTTIILGSIFLGVKSFEYYEKFKHHLVPGIADFHLDDSERLLLEHGEEELKAAQESGDEEAIEHAETIVAHGEAVQPRHVEIFMAFYFGMTGLHALHMIIGIPILGFYAYKAFHNSYSAEYYTPVEMCGLYWHFVDIVWVFLYPLLYLIR